MNHEHTQSGEISVTTEHIFPIIKRWLYSDKDIFLRELVSNASDAITKLSRLRSLSEAEAGEAGRIDVVLDPDKGTLTVSDNGIGMTFEEVERYINQIALSGALEFIEKYESDAAAEGIIGHFGLGFYSAFMVASRVELHTKSHTDAPAVLWSCTDLGTFEMKAGEREKCGTDVVLYLSEEERDYLSREKCAAILEKYCAFLAYPIYLSALGQEETEQTPVNETEPLWMKSAADATEQEYRALYHKLFGHRSEPLFWVHLNADYPLNFKGILYFPRINHQFDSMEGEVKLYYNRVFVADNIREVVPEYLLSLKGVLDCPELPLNVSRSFLQNSSYVAKLSAHIAKKVADKLSELFRANREQFEGFSEDLRPFLEYGAIKDAKFFSRVRELLLFENTEEKYTALSEYLERSQTRRIYYTTDKARQAQYVKLLTSRGTEVLCMPGIMDAQYMSFFEQESAKDGGEAVSFVRVDSDPEGLKAVEDGENEAMKALFSEIDPKLEISFVRLADEGTPALFATEENARRFSDMMRAYRAHTGGEEELPDLSHERFCVNLNCPVTAKLIGEKEERARLLARQIYYTALIAARPLSREELEAFLENNYRLLKD